MSLEDELKLQEANQKISDLMTELNETKEKVTELITTLNEAKNKEIMLSGEVRTLQAEIKALEAKGKNVDILNDRIEYLEKERKNLEDDVKRLEEKVEAKEKKVEELSKDKEDLLMGKNDILQQMTEKELELQKRDQKIGELRIKFKESSSDLLNKSIEIEKLLKKTKGVDELEKKIEELEQRDSTEGSRTSELEEKIKVLESQLTQSQNKIKQLESSKETSILEGTGIISTLEEMLSHLKKTLTQARSTLRLVLPDINDLNKYEITSILKEIPNSVLKNIAAKIGDPYNDNFVNEMKNYCKLTNYSDKQFIAFNVDSNMFSIGVFKGNELRGVYTDAPELIELMKQTIMEPFIKGRKLIS